MIFLRAVPARSRPNWSLKVQVWNPDESEELLQPLNPMGKAPTIAAEPMGFSEVLIKLLLVDMDLRVLCQLY